ncbi:MAG TPA: hypothetical protein PKM88_06980 [bacterium]|nr:hypothetical protein [bacterium]
MIRATRLALGILLAALLTGGCQTTQAAVAADTAAVAVPDPGAHPREFLTATADAVRSLTATMKLRVTADGRRFTALGALAVAAPDTVQLEVNGPLGLPMLTLAMHGDTLTLVDYPHQRYVQANRNTLPARYRGWAELWRLFPLLDTAVVQAAAWTRDTGDTWVGVWGDADGRHYRLRASAACGLTEVEFRQGEETAGALILTEPDSVVRLPRRVAVAAPGIAVDGELVNVVLNPVLRVSAPRIPLQFTAAPLPE